MQGVIMKTNKAVEQILETMSLREKINQTIVVLLQKGKPLDFCPGGAFFGGQIITEADESGIDTLKRYLSEVIDSCNIPPLITSDFENGCGSMVRGLTPMPYMMALGATEDLCLAYDYGKATALEARLLGANWSLSPVSDLNINCRNPLVNNRAMTDNVELACKMIPEIIKGMQDYGLSACAKHFPGDGVDYRDQHITTTVNSLSMEEWKQTFGKLYQDIIATGVDSIMPGHISLPDYPQRLSARFGKCLPATLNKDLIIQLLKGEFGFEGIVVTDALNMGGFHGWFDTHEEAELESFKAGCDMLLWPSEHYGDNLEKAIMSGEISMERLDDAVRRILTIKQKKGLLDSNFEHFRDISEEETTFVKGVQRRCAEKSITLIRDNGQHFPLQPEKTKRIGLIIVAEHLPAKKEAIALKEELEHRGFAVENYVIGDTDKKAFYARNDVILYALFSRPFRPIGFLDYSRDNAWLLAGAFMPDGALKKTIFVSFGSPYFGEQYLERAGTYVNAYAMLDCSCRGFIKAACGEIAFEGKSPVKLK